MKNKLLLGLISAGIILTSTNAYALTGNATVDFTGNDTINVGDTFVVRMNVKDVFGTTDGIVSFGGNLEFDSDMIEYVSSNSENAPYTFQINEEANYKFAGLDFTLENGILENTTVYEFTFKALKEGNTTITLVNQKLTDSKDYVNTNVIAKNIKIKLNEEELKEEKVEIKEVKTEKEENKEVRIAKVEKHDEIKNENSIKETLNKLEKMANLLIKNIFKMFK